VLGHVKVVVILVIEMAASSLGIEGNFLLATFILGMVGWRFCSFAYMLNFVWRNTFGGWAIVVFVDCVLGSYHVSGQTLVWS
jgi:hypothetical protein